MAKILSPSVKFQGFDLNGDMLSGGLLYTYRTGTVTNKTTYSNSTGTANANPVVLDSRGEADLWLDVDEAYTFVLKTAAGVTIWTKDAVTPGSLSTLDFTQAGAGAATRTAQSKMREHFSVADYGILGDGTTDNAANLLLLGAQLRANTNPVRLYWPPSATTYRTSRNEWSRGIKNLVMEGYGASLVNINASATNFINRPFIANAGTWWNDAYGSVYAGASQQFGYLINSQAGGTQQVTTTTAGDAANFAAGNKVLIYGWGQLDGAYPPSARYFEWHEVVTATAGTGVITLVKLLSYDYDANWWDMGTGKGAPRILNLDRSGFYNQGEYLRIEGMNFPQAVAASSPHPDVMIDGYNLAEIINCTGEGLTLSSCEKIVVRGGKWRHSEMDKIVDHIRWDGVEVEELVEGTGVRFVEITGGTKVTSLLSSQSRQLRIKDAVLSGVGGNSNKVIIQGATSYAQQLLDVEGVHAVARTSTLTGIVHGGAAVTFTIDAGGVVSNTKVLVAVANDAAAQTLLRQLQIGGYYYKTDGSNFVRITKMYKNSASTMAIEGAFAALPVAAEVYSGGLIQEIRTRGIALSGDYALDTATGQRIKEVLVDTDTSVKRSFADRDEKSFSHTWTEADLIGGASGSAIVNTNTSVRARLRRLRVQITQAYTGASAANTLRCRLVQAAATTYMDVNTKLAGVRTIYDDGTSGAQSLDVLTATGGAYGDVFRFFYTATGSVFPTYADPVELPKFTMTAEFTRE